MIFLDTGFLLALEIEEDEHHAQALRIYEDIINRKYGDAVLSDYIFDETMTLVMSRTGSSKGAARLGSGIRDSYSLIRISDAVFESAWEIFRDQKGALSFTDCASIALMEDIGIGNIATFDRGFRNLKGINVVNS